MIYEVRPAGEKIGCIADGFSKEEAMNEARNHFYDQASFNDGCGEYSYDLEIVDEDGNIEPWFLTITVAPHFEGGDIGQGAFL